MDKTIDDIEKLKYKYPYFIFKSTIINWKDLIPPLSGLRRLELRYELISKKSLKSIDKKILTTFPIPSNYSGSNIKKIKYNNDEIIFPNYGEYYIHTNFSPFKILILNDNEQQTKNILNIFKFVSGNCVHCDSDNLKLGDYFDNIKVENLYQILFSTDQPLKLRCNGITVVLDHILKKEGYETQMIQLKGHVLLQVYFNQYKKYGLLDPAYGVMIIDRNDNILSIQEVFDLFKNNKSHIKYKKLVNKKNIKKVYTQDPNIDSKFYWTSDFSWSPDKDCYHSLLSPIYDFLKLKYSYLKILSNYCQSWEII